MINPDEIEPNQEIERKVRSVFQIQDPDPLFIDRLQEKLADRFKDIERSGEHKNIFSGRLPWLDRNKLLFTPIAWGAIGIIFILFLIWGIKTLIPGFQPSVSTQSTPSPMISPTPRTESTRTEGTEATINLPTQAGTTVPWPKEVITATNASQVTELARWRSGGGSSVAISPDMKIIASGSSNGSIVLLRANNGQTLRTLAGHTDAVSSLAFSPDGTMLASGSIESTKLWDVASGNEINSMVGQQTGWFEQGVPCVTFSPDGKILAFGAIGGQVMLWDVTKNVELRALGEYGEHADGVTSVAFSPDGKILAAGYNWGSIAVWDVASGEKLQTLTGHAIPTTNNPVSGLVFTHDGKNLISAARNMHVMFWDTATWSEIRTVSWTGESEVHSLVLSPDGAILVFGGWSAPIVFMDAASGEVLNTLNSLPNSQAFSPDGKVLITVTEGGTIHLWGIAPPNVIQSETNIGLTSVEVTPTVEIAAQATSEELSVEKIPIPILATGENIQPGEWSPDGSYIYYSQQEPIGEPGTDPVTVTLSFLDVRTGETCESLQETVNIGDEEWGYEGGWIVRARWIIDNRLLYLSRSGELLAITPCSESIENWSASLPEAIISLSNAKANGSQVLLQGEQAYWLFAPSTRQSVKVDIPVPEEGMITSISWSPGDEELISCRLEDRQGRLWIILERIDTATGSASPITEIQGSQELRNSSPIVAHYNWVSKEKVLVENTITGMRLYDISTQPIQYNNVFPDPFGFEEAFAASFTDVVFGTGQQDYHLVFAAGYEAGGQYYLFHGESGVVDQYPLDPPLLVVFPGGQGGIAESFVNPPSKNVFRVIMVDSDLEPYDLVVKGHTTVTTPWSFATILPGAQQVMFSSRKGVSLVDLKSGEIQHFWELENQDQYQDFYTMLSPDGKSVVVIASNKVTGEGVDTQGMYCLNLEP